MVARERQETLTILVLKCALEFFDGKGREAQHIFLREMVGSVLVFRFPKLEDWDKVIN